MGWGTATSFISKWSESSKQTNKKQVLKLKFFQSKQNRYLNPNPLKVNPNYNGIYQTVSLNNQFRINKWTVDQIKGDP